MDDEWNDAWASTRASRFCNGVKAIQLKLLHRGHISPSQCNKFNSSLSVSRALFTFGYKICLGNQVTVRQLRPIAIYTSVYHACPADQSLLLSTSLPLKGQAQASWELLYMYRYSNSRQRVFSFFQALATCHRNTYFTKTLYFTDHVRLLFVIFVYKYSLERF